MDILLIFSIIILGILLLNTIILVLRLRIKPPRPIGRGIGLALGLAMGLALWLPLGYIFGNQNTGIIVGSIIGIAIGAGLELWSRRTGAER